MGGVPKDPKLIEAWLRTKAGVSDTEEVRAAVLRTLSELGAEVRPDMTFAEIEAASEKIAGVKETTGFKRDEQGLYLEARQFKAGLKESTNILYAGERVGPTKKGPRAYLAERVFVSPDAIYLDRTEPDGIEMVVGHVTGPQGPRSTLGYHEYVRRACVVFDVLVTQDSIPKQWWPELWTHMEENGFGALRSQGYGKCDLVGWDEVAPESPAP
jgi:hypothetical protein